MTDPLDERIDRSFEPMVVDAVAPEMYRVTTLAGREHVVDVRDGVCGCEDFEYSSAPACKHLIRVRAIHEGEKCEPLPDFEEFCAAQSRDYAGVYND